MRSRVRAREIQIDHRCCVVQLVDGLQSQLPRERGSDMIGTQHAPSPTARISEIARSSRPTPLLLAQLSTPSPACSTPASIANNSPSWYRSARPASTQRPWPPWSRSCAVPPPALPPSEGTPLHVKGVFVVRRFHWPPSSTDGLAVYREFTNAMRRSRCSSCCAVATRWAGDCAATLAGGCRKSSRTCRRAARRKM